MGLFVHGRSQTTVIWIFFFPTLFDSFLSSLLFRREWLRNINKWASIPKIEIDFISLKDYSGYKDADELAELADESANTVGERVVEWERG